VPLYVMVAALAVASAIPLLYLSVVADRMPDSRVSRNLTAGLSEGGDLRRLVLSQSPTDRLLRPFVAVLAAGARRISPRGMASSLERRVEIAGVRWPMERVFALKLCLGLLLAGTAVAWALAERSPLSVLAVPLGYAVGYFGPDSILARRARARQLAITHALPDTLDQLTICVEAGLGFDAALLDRKSVV
jgi:tight adherence protein C